MAGLSVNLWRGVPAFLKGWTTFKPRAPEAEKERSAEHQAFEHAPGTRPAAAEAAMGGLERSLASEQNRARGSDSVHLHRARASLHGDQLDGLDTTQDDDTESERHTLAALLGRTEHWDTG